MQGIRYIIEKILGIYNFEIEAERLIQKSIRLLYKMV